MYTKSCHAIAEKSFAKKLLWRTLFKHKQRYCMMYLQYMIRSETIKLTMKTTREKIMAWYLLSWITEWNFTFMMLKSFWCPFRHKIIKDLSDFLLKIYAIFHGYCISSHLIIAFFFIHKKKVLNSHNISMDIHVLRSLEHDLTIF